MLIVIRNGCGVFGVVFVDGINGLEMYCFWFFLIDEFVDDGIVVIDFNRVYLLLCVFFD